MLTRFSFPAYSYKFMFYEFTCHSSSFDSYSLIILYIEEWCYLFSSMLHSRLSTWLKLFSLMGISVNGTLFIFSFKQQKNIFPYVSLNEPIVLKCEFCIHFGKLLLVFCFLWLVSLFYLCRLRVEMSYSDQLFFKASQGGDFVSLELR